jgi:DNA-binding transcriptional regulator YhcF (GntR family)
MASNAKLTHDLRERIVGMLHVGRIHGGDRLPSIRELAAQYARNPRTVRGAIEVLTQEGLVEIRGRSGVFVARQEVLAGDLPEETVGWLTSVISEGWKRRLDPRAVLGLLRRSTQSVPIRCGLVEVVEDAIVAIRYELEHEFGFEVRVISPRAIAAGAEDFADVDFFVATSFLAPSIHGAISAMHRQLVVLTAHAGLQRALRDRLAQGTLTVVAVDADFGERIRVPYRADGEVRVVLASDRKAIAALDPADPVLLTRAAHAALGDVYLRLLFPHSPTISLEAAQMLARMLVLRNLAAAAAG